MEKKKKTNFREFNKSKKALYIVTAIFIVVVAIIAITSFYLGSQNVKKNNNSNYQSIIDYVDNSRKNFSHFINHPTEERWEEEIQNIDDLKTTKPKYEYYCAYTIGKEVYFNNSQKTKRENKLYLIINIKYINNQEKEVEVDINNINVFVNPYITNKKPVKGISNKLEKNKDNTLINKKEYDKTKNKYTLKKGEQLIISILVDNIETTNDNVVYFDIDRSFNDNRAPLQAKLQITKKGIELANGR